MFFKRRQKPRIGVTVSVRGSRGMWLCNKTAIWLAGGKAVRLTVETKPLPLNQLDGLVIGGGDDISAHLYKGEIAPEVRVDAARDHLEQTLLDYALNKNLPVLGICRGSQMINIQLGGNLHEDIYKVYKETPRMRSVLPKKTVRIKENSRLYRILGCNSCRVNTLHHQSVDRLGRGLHIVARDKWNIVQAIEHPSYDPFLLGVQWHPEFLFFKPNHLRLFRALVDAAKTKIQANQ